MRDLKEMTSEITRSLFKNSLRRPKTEQAKESSLDAKTVGVIDTNLGIDHALALSKEYEVYYWLANWSAFPMMQDQKSGDGFENIKKVDDEGELLDKDFIVITDCYFGKRADNWRADGMDVYSTSEEWGDIENKKIYGWNRLKEMGVGVPDGVIVNGLEELLKEIRKRQDGKKVFFIKTDYRGNRETGSGVKNDVEALTAVTQAGYGPYLTDMPFLLQDQCPGEELGLDIYFNGKDFLKPFLFTIERKGAGTVGVWVESNDLDELILDKVKPSLIETDYRGNISFEFFWDGILVRVHDPTSRNPYPNSTLHRRFIKNYPKVIRKIAAGEDVKIQIDPQFSKYVAQVGVYTDDIETWRAIHFPEEIEDRIGFRRVVKRDGEHFFCPGDQLVATASGAGKTPEAAIDDAYRIADQIEASNTYIPWEFKTHALKVIEKVNQFPGNLRF